MAAFRVLPMLLLSCLTASVLAPVGARAVEGAASSGAWRIEEGTAEPSYAVADAVRTNLNAETVVLSCEAGAHSRLLQLQLFMSDEGALQPTYKHTAALKDDPKAVVAIDGKEFPVDLLFADDHVVLADTQDGRIPMLSPALADALQAGKTMTVRVDLLAEPAGGPAGAPAMDGEMVVDLQAPGARDAIAAVRRCAEGASPNIAEVPARR
jgi:hypothetical protein